MGPEGGGGGGEAWPPRALCQEPGLKGAAASSEGKGRGARGPQVDLPATCAGQEPSVSGPLGTMLAMW